MFATVNIARLIQMRRYQGKDKIQSGSLKKMITFKRMENQGQRRGPNPSAWSMNWDQWKKNCRKNNHPSIKIRRPTYKNRVIK